MAGGGGACSAPFCVVTSQNPLVMKDGRFPKEGIPSLRRGELQTCCRLKPFLWERILLLRRKVGGTCCRLNHSSERDFYCWGEKWGDLLHVETIPLRENSTAEEKSWGTCCRLKPFLWERILLLRRKLWGTCCRFKQFLWERILLQRKEEERLVADWNHSSEREFYCKGKRWRNLWQIETIPLRNNSTAEERDGVTCGRLKPFLWERILLLRKEVEKHVADWNNSPVREFYCWGERWRNMWQIETITLRGNSTAEERGGETYCRLKPFLWERILLLRKEGGGGVTFGRFKPFPCERILLLKREVVKLVADWNHSPER